MGDHVYKKTEIYSLFDEGKPICKPANFPADSPGPEYLIVDAPDGTPVALFCLLGRIFMRPVDCPFRAADRILDQLAGKAKVIVVDIHAEATSEKQLMLRHLLGRVSAVLGTHTHVPTADASVHPPGTAYITDVGMTGPYDSVIGRRYDRVLQTTLTFEPTSFEVATGDPRVSGALFEVDPSTGNASSIELVHLDKTAMDSLAECAPLET
jgi:metallophosphoesterase (TIGR00282 family)